MRITTKLALFSECMAMILAFTSLAMADVALPNMFSDDAIFQRGIPVNVWGSADDGEKVAVSFNGQTQSTTCANGHWRVTLSPMQAGGPYDLTVKGKNTLTRRNILIGDIWLCGGQSNMGTTMAGAQWWMSQCPGANFPNIRILNIPTESAVEPADDIPVRWYPLTSADSMSLTAIGFFFGRQLYQDLNVPIGIIQCTAWGSAAEPFVPLPALKQNALFTPMVDKLANDLAYYKKNKAARDQIYAKQLADYQLKMDAFQTALAQNDPGLKDHWEDPTTDTSAWATVHIPGNWENTDLKGQAGSVWLRHEVPVVDSWAGKELRIFLGGAITDSATVYFNGKEIGTTDADTDNVGFRVPPDLSRAGNNTLVVRVVNSSRNQMSVGNFDFLTYLAPADGGNGDERMPMPGYWKYKAGYTVPRDQLPVKPDPPEPPMTGQAGGIYNAMIAPIAGYGIKGVLWYQGESNADHPIAYRTLLPLLITSWRKAWGQNFAFLYVQLPNFLGNGKPNNYIQPAPDAAPGDLSPGWAPLREAQLKTLSVPDTGMVVTIDIGETWSIHPNNKKTVADRLVQTALGIVYGRKIVFSGPLYDSMKIEGDRIRIRFQHSDSKLVARGGQLKQFSIAGNDQKFVWAKARIEGDTVVVSSDQVKQPVAVRYAFCGDPEGANLFNDAGLPASPFRTDDWELKP